MSPYEKSEALFKAASELIPGGVNSPVRAWQAVGLTPRIIVRGAGARVFDVDGNSYLDYVGSWGPLILGHAAPPVVAAVAAAAAQGTSFGAPTPGELELARVLCAAVPGLDDGAPGQLRHGSDHERPAAGPGRHGPPPADQVRRLLPRPCRLLPGGRGQRGPHPGHSRQSRGAPGDRGLTVSLPYNDLEAVGQAAGRYHGEIAAIIVEPVAGNMGVVPPRPGFLEGLRQICDAAGILLIFDEVITGFRVARGGAQELYGVKPDLTCLGKIIGGGLPVGAYGGRRDLMTQMAPSGPIYQAGTLSGNPVAVAAGLATLTALTEPGTYEDLEEKGAWLARELANAAARQGVDLTVNRVGSMLTLFFTAGPVNTLEEAKKSDLTQFRKFFQGMLEAGISLPPSQFEALFISRAHTPEDLEYTVAAAERVWSRWP